MRFGRRGGSRYRETPFTSYFKEAKAKIGFANFDWQAYYYGMSLIKLLFGGRKVRHQGAGVPTGQLLEYRAIAILLITLLVGFGSWIWMKRVERYSYTSQNIGQISTASGAE